MSVDGLIHAGHERRAARRTGRGGGEDARVAHAFRGQPVEVRRADELLAVAAEVELDVLADEPEDVGLPGNQWRM